MNVNKTCRTCKQNLSLDHFTKSKSGKHGVKAHCKPCMAAMEQARWVRSNPASTEGAKHAKLERDQFHALFLKSFPRPHGI